MRKAPRPSGSPARRARAKRRSPCPLACTLDLIGDRWTLLIIRDLFAGRSHYHQFLQSPERIATNILAQRLERLVELKLIAAAPDPAHAGRSIYTLTPRGQSLRPILESIMHWGLANIPGTESRIVA